jgi:hypothetical protein
MSTPKNAPARPAFPALRMAAYLALLWGGAIALAAVGSLAGGSAHAQGVSREDTDGWWRFTPTGKTVEVRAVAPALEEGVEIPQDAFYVNLPGAKLPEGRRPAYVMSQAVMQPRPGKEYQLAMGATLFSFMQDSSAAGTHYAISYAGQTHDYVLGLPAAWTQVRLIAELDGDGLPDFLIDVGDDTFLLLSTRAQPGSNAIDAQLMAMNGGC